MNTNMKITATTLFRLAGLSTLVAGLCYVLVGIFHQPNVASSVATNVWEVVHYFAIGTAFFGLIGMTGVYVKQAEKTSWLGLAGYIMFSLWLGIVMGFSFVEAFVLPRLTVTEPMFVEGFMGIFTGLTNEVKFGVLPFIWTLSFPLYLFGGLVFGIATFRAGILPRWAGALFAFGTLLAPTGAVLPADYQSVIAIPVGLAMAWMGVALWSEQVVKASVSGTASPQLHPAGAD